MLGEKHVSEYALWIVQLIPASCFLDLYAKSHTEKVNIWTSSLKKEMGEIEPLFSYQRGLGVKPATPIGLYLENH